jgi:hypothetical protein
MKQHQCDSSSLDQLYSIEGDMDEDNAQKRILVYSKKRELLLRLFHDDGMNYKHFAHMVQAAPGTHHFQLLQWDLSMTTSLEHIPELINKTLYYTMMFK